MVISFDVPLRASDEAVVKFLLEIVFGPQRKKNALSRECLRHDVNGACKIITWILQNHQKRSFTVACNLIYGNTLVLSQQVARLLLDAVRAREVVAFTSYLAEEEERRKKTFEQMQSGFEDDFTTPKKKRRSKAVAEDEYLLASPTPVSIALKQNITMPDVFAMQREDNIVVEDDLVPPTMEQFEMLYGMLDSENRNTTLDLTFLDRCASSSNARNPLDIAFDASPQPNPVDSELQRPTNDFEFQRPTDEFISSQQRTPNKNDRTQEEIFDPAPELADILLYGRLPLLNEGGQRRSMEDEMEDARHHGISAEIDFPLQPMEVPRMISEPILLDPLDIDTLPRTPRPPRSAQKNETAISSESDAAQNDGIRHKIPLREMHDMMENYSSLHYSSHVPLLVKQQKMSVKDMMSPVPLSLRKNCDKNLWSLFKVDQQKFNPSIGTVISSLETDDEEEDEILQQRSENQNLDDLEPIDLSQLKFVQTPLKDTSPMMSPLRRIDDFEMPMEIERPRREDLFEPLIDPIVDPISPRFTDNIPLQEDNWNFKTPTSYEPISHSDDKTPTMIREALLRECENVSPYSFQLENMLPEGATCREAARSFYVVLELLKERELKAIQITPFGPIDLRIAGTDSVDLDDMAMEMDDGDF